MEPLMFHHPKVGEARDTRSTEPTKPFRVPEIIEYRPSKAYSDNKQDGNLP
jgi:hypothetical protein